MRILVFLLTVVSIAEMSTEVAAQVKFHTEKYGCELTVDGTSRGRVAPDAPLTTNLQTGREHLVECESHDIPVKLYSRNYVGSFGPGGLLSGGPALPADVTVRPIAVLPNLVRAASEGKIVVTAIVDSKNVGCEVKKKNPNDQFQEESHPTPPQHPYVIPQGTVVKVTGTPQLHCGDTNLIELSVEGSKAWFRNRDFAFSYNDQSIPLYQPSQDFECCWIE